MVEEEEGRKEVRTRHKANKKKINLKHPHLIYAGCRLL